MNPLNTTPSSEKNKRNTTKAPTPKRKKLEKYIHLFSGNQKSIKKLLLLCLTISFLSGNVKAQEDAQDLRTRLLLGVKAGANYSNVYDSEGEAFHSEAKFGLAGGAFLAIPIGKYLGIQPEALFSQRGFQGTGVILGNSYDFTRTTSYLDFPLLFSVKPARYLTLLAGPQYSFLLRKKDVFANAGTSIEQEKEFETDDIRKNTLCFTGGLDINLRHLVLGARVGWDLQNNSSNGSSTTPRYKNVWYQATIGYRFYNR